MHKKLIKDIIAKKSQADMEELEHIFIDVMHEIKEKDHDLYKRIEYKLYRLVYGNHLNEELACDWVAHMQNKDGTVGEHWTKAQTDQYANDYNKWDWYVAMNMAHSDHFNPKFDTTTYIELAKDWIDDKDVGEGKTLKYYMYVVCKLGV